jgi:hypothetical protein
MMLLRPSVNVTETAIVVVLQEAGQAVDLYRRRHTADGADDMPAHITLLYPFSDSDLLDLGRIEQIRRALTSFAPFNAELVGFRRFERSLDTVLWLAPRLAASFVAMTEALTTAFPEHSPYGGEFESIVPHLTVAVSDDRELLARIEADIASQLPIHVRVREVALFEHTGAGWKVRFPFPL